MIFDLYIAMLIGTVILSILVVMNIRRLTDDAPFSAVAFSFVVIGCLINPIVIGSIFSYGLRSLQPAKARQANQISMLCFVLWLAAVTWFGLNRFDSHL